MKVDHTIELDVPVSTAYNQWTQFEEFPRFMEGVTEVHQLADERLHWAADIAGEHKEWYARITRQVPDEVLSWESEGGATNSGTIVFKPTEDGKTELEVHMDYEAEGFKEQVGGALGVLSRRVEGDLKRFKDFIENRGQETGAWRGEIIHGATADEQSQLHRTGYDAGHGTMGGTTTHDITGNESTTGRANYEPGTGAIDTPHIETINDRSGYEGVTGVRSTYEGPAAEHMHDQSAQGQATAFQGTTYGGTAGERPDLTDPPPMGYQGTTAEHMLDAELLSRANAPQDRPRDEASANQDPVYDRKLSDAQFDEDQAQH